MTDQKCGKCKITYKITKTKGVGNYIVDCLCTNPDHKEPVDFDITKHEWSDKYTEVHCVCDVTKDVILSVQDDSAELSRADAIALAKHFKLTPEDLT